MASGAGLERFRKIVERQGGDPRVVDDYTRLPSAPERHTIKATRTGFVTYVDAEIVGRASVALGAGRDTVDAGVDHAVGIMIVATEGDRIHEEDPVFELHYRDRANLPHVIERLRTAIAVGSTPPAPRQLFLGEVH
jgi:pyrimidine-nucleoside phosphorylase